MSDKFSEDFIKALLTIPKSNLHKYTPKVPAKYSTGLLRASFNIGYNDSLNN
ncbi:MAG: hypothetical protein K6E78_06055 [Treponema sp.]|nr:hypothetical protein [Treponema sp.]